MSTDCYCPEHRNYFECQTMYYGKAHYPMPAIIYDTILDRHIVTIWNGNECVRDFYNDDCVI